MDACHSPIIRSSSTHILNGEIDRLVVVERLENPPSPMIAAAWLTTAIKGLFKPFERGSGT